MRKRRNIIEGGTVGPRFPGEDEGTTQRPKSASTSGIFLRCSDDFSARVNAAAKALRMTKSELLRWSFSAVMGHLDKILKPELDRMIERDIGAIQEIPLSAFASAQFSTAEIRERLLKKFEFSEDADFAGIFKKGARPEEVELAVTKLVDSVLQAAAAEYKRALIDQREDAVLQMIAGEDPDWLNALRSARAMGARSTEKS